MFTQENAEDIPSFGTRNLGSILLYVSIMVDHVWKQLCRLKPYKSSGPDNCHPRIVLELKEGVVQSLLLELIFSKFLSDSYCYLHKGNRNLCNNYRHVSLTSVICTMHYRSKNFLSICQHGFSVHQLTFRCYSTSTSCECLVLGPGVW